MATWVPQFPEAVNSSAEPGKVECVKRNPKQPEDEHFYSRAALRPGRHQSSSEVCQKRAQHKSNATRRNGDQQEQGAVTMTSTPFDCVDFVRNAEGGSN